MDQAADRDSVLLALVVSLAYRSLEQDVVTTTVIQYLRGLPTPERAELIQRSILSQEPAMRRGGAVAWVWFEFPGDEGLKRAAIEALVSSSLSSNRQAAAAGLAKHSRCTSDWELNALGKLLRDADARVRIRAAAVAGRCQLDQVGSQLIAIAQRKLDFYPVPPPTEDERPFMRPVQDDAYRFVAVREAANAYGQLCGDAHLVPGLVWKIWLVADTENELVTFIQSFADRSDGSLSCEAVAKLSSRLREVEAEYETSVAGEN